MRTCKLLIAAISAAALLGMLATTATAGRLEMSAQRWKATFASWEIVGVFGTSRCALTLEGSLHSRTMSKVAGSLIGYITRAGSGGCSAFSTTVLTETLPWHVRYLGFTGTLPTIGTLSEGIVGFAIRIREPGGITCLFRSTETEPARGTYNIAGGSLTSITLGGRIRSGAECLEVRAEFRGTSISLTEPSSERVLTLTLI